MNIRRHSNGFGIIPVMLIILALGVAAFIGWYVWQQNSDTGTTTQTGGRFTTGQKSTQRVYPNGRTAGWVTYSSPSGNFTLKYPKEWVTADNPERCVDTLFLLGTNSDTVGKCGSSFGGQMLVTWANDPAVCDQLDTTTWATDSTENAKVSGVSATKTTLTAKASDAEGASPEGTKLVQYCFTVSDTTYLAQYEQRPTWPDVLDDFNAMMTKTFTVAIP